MDRDVISHTALLRRERDGLESPDILLARLFELYALVKRYELLTQHLLDTHVPMETEALALPLMTLQEYERHARDLASRAYLTALLDAHHWNRTKVAEAAGISYKSLLNRIEALGLTK